MGRGGNPALSHHHPSILLSFLPRVYPLSLLSSPFLPSTRPRIHHPSFLPFFHPPIHPSSIPPFNLSSFLPSIPHPLPPPIIFPPSFPPCIHPSIRHASLLPFLPLSLLPPIHPSTFPPSIPPSSLRVPPSFLPSFRVSICICRAHAVLGLPSCLAGRDRPGTRLRATVSGRGWCWEANRAEEARRARG